MMWKRDAKLPQRDTNRLQRDAKWPQRPKTIPKKTKMTKKRHNTITKRHRTPQRDTCMGKLPFLNWKNLTSPKSPAKYAHHKQKSYFVL